MTNRGEERGPVTGCAELAEQFEAQRGQLGALAVRLLGPTGEAQDAVQETWLRLARNDTDEVGNLPGWLRTTLTRICLDMLRARRARRETFNARPELDDAATAAGQCHDPEHDPEQQAVLADSVGRALLVVLDTLQPEERIVFVLHDMFAVPFAQIAPIVGRTPGTAKKLASRARRKVQGTSELPAGKLDRDRVVVSAFLAAVRAGDLTAVLAVLAPDAIRRADPAALPPGVATEVRGAQAIAEGTTAGRAKRAELALVNGRVGAVVILGGKLRFALTFTITNDKITTYDVIADPGRLAQLDLAVLDWPPV